MGLDCGGTSRSNSDDTGYSCEIHVKLVDDYISPGQFWIPDNSGFQTILDLSLLHVPINHSKNEAILNKGVFTGIYGILCHNRHFLISQNYEVKMNYRFYSI